MVERFLHRMSTKYGAIKNLVSRSYRILNRRQRRTYARSLIFMVISSILELFTLGLLIPFITALVAPDSFRSSLVLRMINRLWTYPMFTHPATVIGILVILFFLIKNIVSYYLYAYYNQFVYSIASDISKDKIYEYYKLKYPEVQKRNTAEMFREIAFIPIEFSQHIILGSMIIISELLMVSFCAAAMALIQFSIFMFTIMTMVPLVTIAWMLSVRYLRTTRRTIQERSASNLRTLSDSLLVYQEANLYHKESYFSERYTKGQRDLNLQLGKLNSANAIPGRLSEVFAVLGMLLIVFFYFRTGDHLTTSVVTVLTVFAAFAYRVIPSFNKIMNAVVHMHTYSFTVDFIAPVKASLPLTIPERNSPYEPLEFKESIELRNITFGYPDQSIPIIRNLSLRLQKSDFIGIIGRSGVGKTTLIRTLLQFHQPSSGDITIDGKVLAASDLPAWQNLFCYVPQDPIILSDSMKNNIAFGVEERSMDVPAVRKILQQVGLLDVAQQLPQGIESILGERGNDLSGGQKQRLAIGRALYRNAEVFIFDEAFNELDRRSVQELSELVTSLHHTGKTIIMISHHHRILSLCRTLYTLSNGCLQETGKFELAEVEG